jgi:hypothetical protein
VLGRADRNAGTRKTLIKMLVKVSTLARVPRARGKELPTFAMSASKSDQNLLTTGRQFARDRAMKRADHTAAQTRIHDLLAATMLDVRNPRPVVAHEMAGNNAVRAVWTQARRVVNASITRHYDGEQ